jgi:hypothetical protein
MQLKVPSRHSAHCTLTTFKGQMLCLQRGHVSCQRLCCRFERATVSTHCHPISSASAHPPTGQAQPTAQNVACGVANRVRDRAPGKERQDVESAALPSRDLDAQPPQGRAQARQAPAGEGEGVRIRVAHPTALGTSREQHWALLQVL